MFNMHIISSKKNNYNSKYDYEVKKKYQILNELKIESIENFFCQVYN